jgi:O-acetyl-ADP-ribose deacetylase (regulator of RNase III)
MPTTFLAGDIFHMAEAGETSMSGRALAFAADCSGMMTEGIAVAFKKRWPEMAEAFAKHCEGGKMQLGDVFVWQQPGGITVYAVGMQKGKDKAKFANFERAMTSVLARTEGDKVQSVLMSRIGAGKDAVDWTRAKKFLTELGAGNPVQFIVFEKFVRAVQASA